MRISKKIATAAAALALAAGMLAPTASAACPYTGTSPRLRCAGCTPTATGCKSGAAT